MVSEKFRRRLRHEATQWRSEALISPDLFQELSERYDFDTLDTNARDRFVAVLVIVGGVLLGIGVITFVAANWQAIPRSAKVGLLLSLLIGVNAVGFYLWRSPHHASNHHRSNHRPQWRNRLGHGLLICGTLILGANLALMGQLFHQSGTAFGLCLIWGFGVLAMAYGLQLTSLASIACVLVSIGYWIEWVSYGISDLSSPLRLVFDIMPLVIGGAFLPLAYRCRSRVVFGLTVIGVGTSLSLSILELSNDLHDPFGLIAAITLTLPVAFWWAYDDDFWHVIMPSSRSQQNKASEQRASFRPIARSLSIIYLSGVFYYSSFHGLWHDYQWSPPSDNASLTQVLNALVTNPNFLLITLLTIALWVRLGWPRIGRHWHLTATDAVVLVMLVLDGGMVMWHIAIDPSQVFATLLFNILLFLVAAGLMREGLADGDRRQFWYGLVLLILQILSRVLEYDTGLLIKSIAFLLCGVGIIIIGLWFERYVRAFSSTQLPPPQSFDPPDEEVSL